MSFSMAFFEFIVVAALVMAVLAAIVLPSLFIRDARKRSLW